MAVPQLLDSLLPHVSHGLAAYIARSPACPACASPVVHCGSLSCPEPAKSAPVVCECKDGPVDTVIARVLLGLFVGVFVGFFLARLGPWQVMPVSPTRHLRLPGYGGGMRGAESSREVLRRGPVVREAPLAPPAPRLVGRRHRYGNLRSGNPDVEELRLLGSRFRVPPESSTRRKCTASGPCRPGGGTLCRPVGAVAEPLVQADRLCAHRRCLPTIPWDERDLMARRRLRSSRPKAAERSPSPTPRPLRSAHRTWRTSRRCCR